MVIQNMMHGACSLRCYMEFHKNRANGLAADTTSQADRRPDVVSMYGVVLVLRKEHLLAKSDYSVVCQKLELNSVTFIGRPLHLIV